MRAFRGDDSDTAASRSVAIRTGGLDDVADVARLHASQIGEGFLSSLGHRFLQRLYGRICYDQDSFVLVAEDGSGLLGFVAGTLSTRALYRRFLLRDGALAALGSLPRLLGSWRRVLETLRHGGAGPGDVAHSELLAIAVRPEARRRGVAAALVEALLDETERRGAASVDVTVGAHNAPAVALYERAGFVTARRFELHAGTTSLTMRHHRAGPAGTAPA